MRFRQKIFLITFAFVTISINLIGIITINNNYKKLLNARIENNKSNISNIEDMLKFYDENSISSGFLNRSNIYCEISKNNSIIYTNLSINMSEIEQEIKPTEGKIKAIILNKNIYMSTKSKDFEIILVDNVEDVFTNKQEEIYSFINLSIIFSLITAFGLYIIIFLLTRKISKLEKTVKKIQTGEYSARVKNLGNDEIGKLGASFNEMINSVEENILEIQRVSENRKKFIHDLTHEIRTPLTSIIGYSSLIKNGKVQDLETVKEYNNKIYEEGIYLNLISNRLIDIVLLEGEQIEPKDVNLEKIINKVIENNQNLFEEIIFEKAIKEEAIIKSDEILLHSLILNILKNAKEAMYNNSVKKIQISINKTLENTTILKIRDNGKGMREEELKKVIEPFYTISQDRNRKSSGMGLGLPLCIKICEVLKAKLKIESKLGEGTVVTIEFKN